MRCWSEIEDCVVRCYQRIETASARIESASAQVEKSRFYIDATLLLIDTYNTPADVPGHAGQPAQVHIVQNPRALLRTIGPELWMYVSPDGDHYLNAWYLYFSLNNGHYSQLWGPFAEREQAEIYAHAYYWAMPQHFQSGATSPAE